MELYSPCSINKAASGVVNPTGTATTVFTIPHGLGAIPAHAVITPRNALSAALYYLTVDSTNITVTYLAGITGALSIGWFAYI